MRCRVAVSLTVAIGLNLGVIQDSARVYAAGTVPAQGAAGPTSPSGGGADANAGEKPSAAFDEQTVKPEDAAEGAPLRPRENDSLFSLSHARIEQGRGPWPVLKVDYERVHPGTYHGHSLVVHRRSGETQTYLLIGPMAEDKGTFEIELPIRPFQGGPLKDAEIYLVRPDVRYGGKFTPNFKVSNSAVIGNLKDLTLARDWTADETRTLSKPPPDFSNPDAYPNVGEESQFAGNPSGGFPRRFVSPGHPLLGVECRAGQWAQEPCIAEVVPVFSADQPVTVKPRAIAKAGYAVGAVNVKAQQYVDAIQLVFMKLKPDGSLDVKDTYLSDWLGATTPDNAKTTKLGGDGRAIIGIVCRRGAILDGLAVVSDRLPDAQHDAASERR